jgi:hypothetical protein
LKAAAKRNGLFTRLVGPTGGWKRRALVLVCGIGLAGGLALAQDKPDTRGLQVHAIAVEARPLAGFDKSDPKATRFGRLEWRGGAVLTSPSEHFGGWSGLNVDAGGRRFVAVSDAGTWLTGEISYGGGRLTGLASTRVGPLKAQDGKMLTRDRDRDAEAVAIVDGTPAKGNLLISFEGNDRIGRFVIGSNGIAAPDGYLPIPAEVKKARSLDGFEAVTVLRGGPRKGAIVAFAEHPLGKETYHAGWIWNSGAPQRFSMTGIGGFDVTDAAGLADGSLIVLERRFRWNEGVRMRLRRLPAAEIKPGALIAGEVLMEADLNQEIDNMEGLAVHQSAGGETILSLISDDNFNRLLQRTLFLQFKLDGGPRSAARP